MKRSILALLLCTMLAGCATLAPDQMQIQQVIEVPNTTQSLLFDRSRMWYAEAFRSANFVIQYENKDNGTIMGNGQVSDSIMMVRYDMRFLIVTEVKDNKARITATGKNVYTDKGGEIGVKGMLWDHFKEQIEEVLNGYVAYIKPSTARAKSENW